MSLAPAGQSGRCTGPPVAAVPAGGGAADKRCTKCRVLKPLDDFAPNRRAADGRSSWCRKCSNATTRAWRVAHQPRPCVECGQCFTPNRFRPDRLLDKVPLEA